MNRYSDRFQLFFFLHLQIRNMHTSIKYDEYECYLAILGARYTRIQRTI